MDKVDKLIHIIHILKEQGMSSGSIANVTNKSSGPINIAGLPPDTPPVFDLRRKGQKNWNPFFKNLARMQRRRNNKKNK